MDFDELNIYVKAHIDKMEIDVKQKLIADYNAAKTTAIMVCSLLNGNEPPSIYELYPTAFTEEELQEHDAKLVEAFFLDLAAKQKNQKQAIGAN